MTPDPEPSPSRAARKFLLVDDHPGFRQTVRDFLPADAGEVIECANGSEAVEAYATYRPDWTLMDLAMPGLDGLAATRDIRKRFPEARIVILTQHANPECREEARAAGACAFVAKDELSRLNLILQARAPQTGGAAQPINP